MAAPSNVLGERHDEGVFVGHIDDERRDVGLAKEAEGVEAAFTADQQIAWRPISALALRYGDWLLDANRANIFNDFLEDLHVAIPRVQDLNSVDGHERYALWCFSHHLGTSRLDAACSFLCWM